MSRLQLIAWILLGIGITGALGTVYAARDVLARAELHGTRAILAAQAQDSAAMAERSRTLYLSTAEERRTFNAVSRADIVSVADAIEQIGKRTRTSMSVSNAMADVQQTETSQLAQPVILLVRGEGAFSDLMHAAEILETLPYAASMSQLEFERSASGWRMTVRVRLFTAAPLQS